MKIFLTVLAVLLVIPTIPVGLNAEALSDQFRVATEAPTPQGNRFARYEKMCRCCFFEPVRNWHCTFMEVSRCVQEGGICWATGYPPEPRSGLGLGPRTATQIPLSLTE